MSSGAEDSLPNLQTRLAAVRAAISQWLANAGVGKVNIDDRGHEISISHLRAEEKDLMQRIARHADNVQRARSVRRFIPFDLR